MRHFLRYNILLSTLFMGKNLIYKFIFCHATANYLIILWNKLSTSISLLAFQPFPVTHHAPEPHPCWAGWRWYLCQIVPDTSPLRVCPRAGLEAEWAARRSWPDDSPSTARTAPSSPARTRRPLDKLRGWYCRQQNTILLKIQTILSLTRTVIL